LRVSLDGPPALSLSVLSLSALLRPVLRLLALLRCGLSLPALLLPVLLLAACAGGRAPERIQAMPGPSVPPQPPGTCSAGAHAALVGRDATALERVLILGPVRVIRPGMAVTRDLRPGRINFDVGDAGRIARIWCG